MTDRPDDASVDPATSAEIPPSQSVEDADVTALSAAPDAAADAAVRHLLSGLAAPSMPDAVWQRLTAALAAEQATRSGSGDAPAATATLTTDADPAAKAAADAAHDGVPGGSPSRPGTGPTPSQGTRVARLTEERRRRTRVLSGLVAASVAVVAAGIGLSVLRGGTPPAPVAADVAAVPEAGGIAAAAPALRILQSGMSYTQEEFGPQIRTLLTRDDVDDAVPIGLQAERSGAPVTDLAGGPGGGPVGSDGFTATWEGVRGCVSGLVTATQVGQAIVVDRATWEGRDAGVVVLAADQSPTTVDVWVVEPTCGHSDPKVLFFFRTAAPN